MIGRPTQENLKSREMSGFEIVKISSPCSCQETIIF
jgi:hypothetical protein